MTPTHPDHATRPLLVDEVDDFAEIIDRAVTEATELTGLRLPLRRRPVLVDEADDFAEIIDRADSATAGPADGPNPAGSGS